MPERALKLTSITTAIVCLFAHNACAEIYTGSPSVIEGDNIIFDGAVVQGQYLDGASFVIGKIGETQSINFGSGGFYIDPTISGGGVANPQSTWTFNAKSIMTHGGFDTSKKGTGHGNHDFNFNNDSLSIVDVSEETEDATLDGDDGAIILRDFEGTGFADSVVVHSTSRTIVSTCNQLDIQANHIEFLSRDGNGNPVDNHFSALNIEDGFVNLNTGADLNENTGIWLESARDTLKITSTVDTAKFTTAGEISIINSQWENNGEQRAIYVGNGTAKDGTNNVLHLKGNSIYVRGTTQLAEDRVNIVFGGSGLDQVSGGDFSAREYAVADTISLISSADNAATLAVVTDEEADINESHIYLSGKNVEITNRSQTGTAIEIGGKQGIEILINHAEKLLISGNKAVALTGAGGSPNNSSYFDLRLESNAEAHIEALGQNASGITWIGNVHNKTVDINGGKKIVFSVNGENASAIYSSKTSSGSVVNISNGDTLQFNVAGDNASAINMCSNGRSNYYYSDEVNISGYDSVLFDATYDGAEKFGINLVAAETNISSAELISIAVKDGTAVKLDKASDRNGALLSLSSSKISVNAVGDTDQAFIVNNGEVKIGKGNDTSEKSDEVVLSSGGTLISVSNASGEGSSSFSLNAVNLKAVAGNGSGKIFDVSDKAKLNITADKGSIYGDFKVSTNASGTVKLGATQWFGMSEIDDKNSTKLDVEIGKNGTWNVTGDSSLSKLTMNDGGLNLTYSGATASRAMPTYKHVNTKELLGSGGTMHFNMDLAKDLTDTDLSDISQSNDQLVVYAEAEGQYDAFISLQDSLNTASSIGKDRTQNFLVSQGSGKLSFKDKNYYTDGSVGTVWKLRFTPDDGQTWNDAIADGYAMSDGAGKWYLVKVGTYEPWVPIDPSKPISPVNPEVDENLTIGTSALQAIGWLAEKSDLRKRLGEIRYGSQAGAWAKVDSRKDRVGTASGFESETYGIHVGYDAMVGTNERTGWLVGGAFRYSNSDQEGYGVGGTGSGKLDQYTLKAYATYMRDSGGYADFVLQGGYYDQELNGLSNSGMKATNASYHTEGFGASVEVGHRFSFGGHGDDRLWYSDWYFEPQLELSYFWTKGADYKTSTGLKVSQGNADFLNGRAGVVFGKKWNLGSIDSLDKRYFQIALIGGVNYEFLGDQDIRYSGTDGITKTLSAADMDGERFYYGIDLDWQMTQDLRAYARLEREEGNAYTKEYDVSVGLKYSF